MRSSSPIYQDLVLVGGGHSHALALRMLAMKPIEGLRITLISPQSYTPYSGMLPGLIAGHYDFAQTHIDLVRLCEWAGARFIQAEVIELDPQARRLELPERTAIGYDIVSLDIGSQPELDSVPGAREYAVPVKPVAHFWSRWVSILEKIEEATQPTSISLVGGGAGSVELALAMAFRLSKKQAAITLWCGSEQILPGYNDRARGHVLTALQRAGVDVHYSARVTKVSAKTLHFATGDPQHFDEVFWCTGAAAAPWVKRSGLTVDEAGFLSVADTLQSVSDGRVFAAGDIAAQTNHPRPKAGVYAVRQAPILAANLRAAVLDKPLRAFKPQDNFLSLISLGDETAVADKAIFSACGAWVWRWKDRIDTKFMQRFEALPKMMPIKHWGTVPEAVQLNSQAPCGGCGAKVGSDLLQATLETLAIESAGTIMAGAEDAASVPLAGSTALLQSVDVLRGLVSDPWLMGRIAANHALSDLYACAAKPVSALAVVTLPFAGDRIVQRDLLQILAGALFEFSQVGCVLNGGHTLQGPELSIGFVVNGIPLAGRSTLNKLGSQAGDVLVLTKPLGVGAVFAAHMQLAARGRDVEAATTMMLQSNAQASVIAQRLGAHACTDVTGFGLAGHLQEMLSPAFSAQLNLSHVPALPGALGYLQAGVQSTMQSANMRSASTHRSGSFSSVDEEARMALLFDPQTSGGLLIACAADVAPTLIADLVAAGYSDAVAVGSVLQASGSAANAIEICP
ncbi:MAG: selenide, water dikinase SelD [Pseudomonadales bacterium]